MTRPDLRVVENTPWERAESYVSERRLTLGERLVATFRANGETLSFYFAMCAITFAVGVIVFAYVERGL